MNYNLLDSVDCGKAYSLVPKERHVRKESNGSTLGLCVGPTRVMTVDL